jgi:hypothetical protein
MSWHMHGAWHTVGNERADALAREAMEHGSSPGNNLPIFLQCQLPISISAIKQSIGMNIKAMVKKWWTKSLRFRKMRLIDPLLPLDKYIKITSSLNRRQTSILTQLHTGHAPINKHLHKIQKIESPNCPQATCNGMIEDIHHLLFTCPHYTHKRYLLTWKISRKILSLAMLLAYKDTIPHTLEYLNKTGRFRHIYRDIAPD